MTLLAPRRKTLRGPLGGAEAFDPDFPVIDVRARRNDVDTTHRILVALAAIGILGPAFATWTGIITVHLTGVASVLETAGSLGLLVGAVAVRTERGMRIVELSLLVLAVVALGAWATSVVSANPAYGTDEAAFEQYAAHLLTMGLDPYAHNLFGALRQFRVPIQYATYTTSGGVVSTLGYPALSVLLVVPFEWITGGVQAVPVMNTVALAATMVLSFFILPKRFRSLAVLFVVGLPILFGYAVSGVDVILAVPFLVVVAWRFTETGRGGHLSRRGIAQAVCLGLAISMQQIAWFIFPFVLVALWVSRRAELDRKAAALLVGRYSAIALGVFSVVNAGFIVASPSAWANGVLEPLVQHAIPYGQGLIDLPVFAGIGGGSLGYFTYGAVALVFGLLVSLFAFYRVLWRCTFVMPSLALFFPTRSLAEYWMTLVVVWLVSFFASPPGPQRELGLGKLGSWAGARWKRALIAGAAFVPGMALVCLAVASPAPLAIRVVGIRTNGQYERVWELAVWVTNRSNEALEPHFATNSIGQMTPFWHQLKGPTRLGPGRSARYLLAAPNVGAMPGITQSFQLDAVTNVPETISVTHDIVTEPYSAWIYQSEVNRVLPAGGGTTLTVQLRSPLGGRVDKPNVELALGQVIYTQTQLVPGEARINHAAEGQSPVTMRTNAHGEATFHVTDSTPQGQPIYFQAWTVSQGGYPFGYSEIVDVLWSGK